MIFHPTPGTHFLPEQGGLQGENVFLQAEDGVRIHGFWLSSQGSTRALLFLHGNAGNASHRLPNASELVALKTNVLLLDYRGYGLSEGTPSEAGVYLDAQAGLAHLTNERGFVPKRIFVFGRSLGGAVAVDLAHGRELAGLILESTFTSAAEMATSILPFTTPLVGGRFDSIRKISQIRTPLLVFHGDRDQIVPYRLGKKLFHAAREPKAFEKIAGAGHNDTTQVGGRPYFERIRQFLDRWAPT
ncbi:alpha/beta hydrolase [Myxococcota bacterium]|nr:alpha/beta hydrolase [Myxococcota bacterium]